MTDDASITLDKLFESTELGVLPALSNTISPFAAVTEAKQYVATIKSSLPDLCLGIAHNPLTTTPKLLTEAAEALDIPTRVVDLATLSMAASPASQLVDRFGAVRITHLTPPLLFWQPAATAVLKATEYTAYLPTNTISAIETADDKAQTALVFEAHAIPQVPTWITPQDVAAVSAALTIIGLPAVLKRSTGAKGRWVRLVRSFDQLAPAIGELASEGIGSLVIQPYIETIDASSMRAIVLDDTIIASLRRTPAPGEWRSNLGAGSTQVPDTLTIEEAELAKNALKALGLRYGGVDILRTSTGPKVLEVDSCPGFTKLTHLVPADVAMSIVLAAIRPPESPLLELTD